jgi:hypothetical protein
MKQNILGLSFLFISIVGGFAFLSENSNLFKSNINSKSHNSHKKPNIYINNVWKKDFQRLSASGQLPKAWGLINQIILIPTDPLTKELSMYLKAPVKVNKAGNYRLEVTIITHQSEKNKTQVLLQHNIIEVENENTIWELNRTYNLTSN